MAPIDDIARVIAEAIAKALADREAELTRIAVAGGKEAGPGLLQDVGSIVDIITNIIGSIPIVGQLAGFSLEPVKVIEGAAGKQGRAFGIGYMLGYAAFNMAQPLFLPIQHAIADAAQTEIFDPNTAATLDAKGLIAHEFGRSEAAGGNLSGDHYDKLVESARQYPDVSQVMDAWLKRQVNESDVDTALQHHAIPREWWPALKALRRYFLSPADLALANLRGIINDTTMNEYAAELGITPDDMQVLIGNTGEPPGIMQMLFLYRRGIIQEEDLRRAIKQSRIRDEWIDDVIALRYQPMTTADAARDRKSVV